MLTEKLALVPPRVCQLILAWLAKMLHAIQNISSVLLYGIEAHEQLLLNKGIY